MEIQYPPEITEEEKARLDQEFGNDMAFKQRNKDRPEPIAKTNA